MTEWRYLPDGRVVHALDKPGDNTAWCGRWILPASQWLGTGSQREYEEAASLPKCGSCLRILGGHGG